MIKKKITQYLDFKGITKYKFYQITKLSNGFLDKSGSMGVDKCEIICSHFPDLNLNWLILGKGQMIIDQSINTLGIANQGGDGYTKKLELELLDALRENKILHEELAQIKGHNKKAGSG